MIALIPAEDLEGEEQVTATGFSLVPKLKRRVQTLRAGSKAWLGHHPTSCCLSAPTRDTPHSLPLYLWPPLSSGAASPASVTPGVRVHEATLIRPLG